ncbi:N-glycosylase/DNA lyase [Fistulifera solaris]|uniref:DNA-(apurinic or apyrimidinic site) lyase n=1 Tax=Fistulifera solaris TaxID=1519565 RepID=A0A1Z5K5Y7_FISSO|nr:N-glycosylase/DNA lyase [Fistulifera solaris]|eukprot:GAX21501.1 N-glycosylase/DNA lyase [Fistulifera solaris]
MTRAARGIAKVISAAAGPRTPTKGKKRSLRTVTPDQIVSSSPPRNDIAKKSVPFQEPRIVDKEDALSDEGFRDLKVPARELRPSATLTTGQCFHWKAVDEPVGSSAWGTHNATQWIGTVRIPDTSDYLVLLLRETIDTTLYKVLFAPPDYDIVKTDDVLYQYFQLDQSLSVLYDQWSHECSRLKRIAACIPGVRVICQDPWECLVSFLCSSNNNIPRIFGMLAKIRRTYGRPLLTLRTSDGNEETFYSFPSFEQLVAKASEDELRNVCGMGYRAKYLLGTMEKIKAASGEPYLNSLRGVKSPLDVQEALIQFPGVGRKVADCIALFSLRQTEAIPVDVHVWDMARRDYAFNTSNVKSLTPTVYRAVGDLFRERFSTHSGWAHSLLFVAELPSFRPVLPSDIREEMESFSKKRNAEKKATKAAKESE